jgi:hypothetical protein
MARKALLHGCQLWNNLQKKKSDSGNLSAHDMRSLDGVPRRNT